VNVEFRAMTNNCRNRDNAVMISSTTPSAKYSAQHRHSCSGTAGRDGRFIWERQGQLDLRGAALRIHCIRAHWPANVLELLLAQIGEMGIDLAANLLVGRS